VSQRDRRWRAFVTSASRSAKDSSQDGQQHLSKSEERFMFFKIRDSISVQKRQREKKRGAKRHTRPLDGKEGA
jgi:hypothetical protein